MNDIEAPEVQKNTKWLAIGAVIAIVGIILSIYSTNHHLAVQATGKTDFACNVNDTLSCDAVVNTSYSEVMGIPLGVWGLGYFLSLLALLGMAFFKKVFSTELQTYTAMVAIGVVVSIIYGLISKIVIGALCPSCLAIYSVTVAQAIALWVFRKEIPTPFNIKELINGGSVAVIICALCAGGFSLLKPGIAPKKMVGDRVVETVNNMPVMNFLPTKHEINIDKSAYSGLGEDYRKGSDNARVVIHEFSDFQCPGCAHAAKSINSLAEKYGDQILVVFKNYPLDQSCNSNVTRKFHEYACRIAVMARCAGQFGKFWQYHDKAFEQRQSATNEQAVEWAKEVGLSQKEIDSCLDSKDIIAKIQNDIKQGGKIPVDATPTVLFNGRKFVGGNFNHLGPEIEKVLKSPDTAGNSELSNPLDEIKDMVESGKAVLLDVREQNEWDAGHLEGALLLPLNSLKGLKKGDKISSLPDGKPFYIYCRSGRRAKIAARVLTALGYKANALPVSFKDLVKSGFGQTQSFGPLK